LAVAIRVRILACQRKENDMEETYNKGDLVELVGQNKIVRLVSDKNDSDHYLASFNIHNDWPPEVIGAIIYVHVTDIFQRVNEE
jgi:hypothetical protein